MIGLQQGLVKLVPYQQVWKSLFVEETWIIRLKLSNNILRFEHVGSTATSWQQSRA